MDRKSILNWALIRTFLLSQVPHSTRCSMERLIALSSHIYSIPYCSRTQYYLRQFYVKGIQSQHDDPQWRWPMTPSASYYIINVYACFISTRYRGIPRLFEHILLILASFACSQDRHSKAPVSHSAPKVNILVNTRHGGNVYKRAPRKCFVHHHQKQLKTLTPPTATTTLTTLIAPWTNS